MERKHIDALEVEIGNKTYTLDFDIDSVKAFGKYSIAHNGRLGDEIFIKYALQKNHRDELMSSKKPQEIQETLATLDEDDFMSYNDVIEHLIKLFMQAIDDEAESVEPCTVTIEKDNSVTVVFDNEKYKLTFLRSDLKDAIIGENSAFSFKSPLELYTIGTSLLQLATKHYNRRFSVKFHDKLFFSLWATKFNKETEDVFPEVLNALNFHISEVANSGIKKSKPAIRVLTNRTEE